MPGPLDNPLVWSLLNAQAQQQTDEPFRAVGSILQPGGNGSADPTVSQRTVPTDENHTPDDLSASVNAIGAAAKQKAELENLKMQANPNIYSAQYAPMLEVIRRKKAESKRGNLVGGLAASMHGINFGPGRPGATSGQNFASGLFGGISQYLTYLAEQKQKNEGLDTEEAKIQGQMAIADVLNKIAGKSAALNDPNVAGDAAMGSARIKMRDKAKTSTPLNAEQQFDLDQKKAQAEKFGTRPYFAPDKPVDPNLIKKRENDAAISGLKLQGMKNPQAKQAPMGQQLNELEQQHSELEHRLSSIIPNAFVDDAGNLMTFKDNTSPASKLGRKDPIVTPHWYGNSSTAVSDKDQQVNQLIPQAESLRQKIVDLRGQIAEKRKGFTGGGPAQAAPSKQPSASVNDPGAWDIPDQSLSTPNPAGPPQATPAPPNAPPPQLPQGSVLHGTSQGKPVYRTPDGRLIRVD